MLAINGGTGFYQLANKADKNRHAGNSLLRPAFAPAPAAPRLVCTRGPRRQNIQWHEVKFAVTLAAFGNAQWQARGLRLTSSWLERLIL